MLKVEDEWVRFPDAEDDLDELYISYDESKVSLDKLIECVEGFGFQPTVKE